MRSFVQRQFVKSRFGRRLTLLVGSTAVGQLALIISAPIITRIYAPDDYGIFVTIASILNIVAVFAALRYEAAIPLCKNDSDAALLTSFVIFLSACFSLISAIFMWLFYAPICEFFEINTTPRIMLWLPLAIIAQGLFLAFDGWGIYRAALRQLAMSKISQGVVMAVGQVLFGLLGNGSADGLIASYILSQVAGAIPMVIGLNAVQRNAFLHFSLRDLKRMIYRYSQFPIFEMWSRAMSTASEMMPAPLVATIYGSTEAGLFGLAQRIVGLPIRFIGISAHQVYASELPRFEHSDQKNLLALFNETVIRLGVIGFGYMILVLIFGPQIFAFVFGESWRISGEMAQLLAPMYLTMLINRPIKYTIQYYERQDLSLLVSLVGLVLLGITFWLAYLGVISMHHSIIFISIGAIIVNIWSLALARALIKGRLKAHAKVLTDSHYGESS